jgi:hypothetical protein
LPSIDYFRDDDSGSSQSAEDPDDLVAVRTARPPNASFSGGAEQREVPTVGS